MNCKTCGKNLGLGQRYVLLDETQMCIWSAPDAVPEVDIREALVLDYYCCEQHAMEACKAYLAQVGAEATWSDVRPFEDCGICKEYFDTTSWHKVLTLSEERGIEDDPQIIDRKYVARFCQSCVPVV